MQLSKFMLTLDYMTRTRRCAVNGPASIAGPGRLISAYFLPVHQFGVAAYRATAHCADSVSIKGKDILRTLAGTHRHGRTKVECYGYVPFRTDQGMQHCVLRIEQLLVVRCDVFETEANPDGIAKIAAGVIFEGSPVQGRGLSTEFNDDPGQGPVRFPTKLKVGSAFEPYRWAVFVHQIMCPLVQAVAIEPGTPSHYISYVRSGFQGKL
jgi:hypothetical protein